MNFKLGVIGKGNHGTRAFVRDPRSARIDFASVHDDARLAKNSQESLTSVSSLHLGRVRQTHVLIVDDEFAVYNGDIRVVQSHPTA